MKIYNKKLKWQKMNKIRRSNKLMKNIDKLDEKYKAIEH